MGQHCVLHGMLRITEESLLKTFVPPLQFDFSDLGIRTFIDNIIDFTTEGVRNTDFETKNGELFITTTPGQKITLMRAN